MKWIECAPTCVSSFRQDVLMFRDSSSWEAVLVQLTTVEAIFMLLLLKTLFLLDFVTHSKYVGQVMLIYLKCLSFLEVVSDYLTVDNGC